MYAYRSQPEITRYQFWRPKGVEDVQELLDRMDKTGFGIVDSWFQLGIYLKDNQELVGDLSLHFLPPDSQQTEIGFTIAPDHQRNGYATEAVEAAIDYLFTTLDVHRVTASVDPKNTASIALVERIGMRKEGHFRQSVPIDGRWEDDFIYAVLNNEWR